MSTHIHQQHIYGGNRYKSARDISVVYITSGDDRDQASEDDKVETEFEVQEDGTPAPRPRSLAERRASKSQVKLRISPAPTLCDLLDQCNPESEMKHLKGRAIECYKLLPSPWSEQDFPDFPSMVIDVQSNLNGLSGRCEWFQDTLKRAIVSGKPYIMGDQMILCWLFLVRHARRKLHTMELILKELKSTITKFNADMTLKLRETSSRILPAPWRQRRQERQRKILLASWDPIIANTLSRTKEIGSCIEGVHDALGVLRQRVHSREPINSPLSLKCVQVFDFLGRTLLLPEIVCKSLEDLQHLLATFYEGLIGGYASQQHYSIFQRIEPDLRLLQSGTDEIDLSGGPLLVCARLYLDAAKPEGDALSQCPRCGNNLDPSTRGRDGFVGCSQASCKAQVLAWNLSEETQPIKFKTYAPHLIPTGEQAKTGLPFKFYHVLRHRLEHENSNHPQAESLLKPDNLTIVAGTAPVFNARTQSNQACYII